MHGKTKTRKTQGGMTLVPNLFWCEPKKKLFAFCQLGQLLNIGTIITMIIINYLEHLYWQLIGLGKDQQLLGILPHFILFLIVNSLVIIIILTHLIMQSFLFNFSMCLASQKWQIYVVLLVMDQSNKGIPIVK